MTHPLSPLGIQVARVLEDLETLRRDYEPMLTEKEPEVERRLASAAAALESVVALTLAPKDGTPTG